ncbi:MAG: glycoside hydrolase family 127 protein [Caulobacterales bacterium]|nr:glycoside hydrolase family 127 protein [Caulobacterales bacterium]MCA0372621.1 glycoside hydrolase family 127 protein [Pseudomonadota bacterium]
MENSLQINRRNLLAGAAIASLIPKIATAATTKLNKLTPYLIKQKIENKAQFVAPFEIEMSGWLGNRFNLSAQNRLLNIDTNELLAGFKAKPGVHPWIGEHVGKWIYASTLTSANNNDEKLIAKLKSTVVALIAAQEKDGYLGTYVKEKRFGLYQDADWDVWSHKYCMIGLLTYYKFYGDKNALLASKKAADLLIATFPAQKSINEAGTHMGMAATSVLEPIVTLYRFTGEQKYLDFATYIVSAMSADNGSKILESLKTTSSVYKTANAKSYEMISNLVGLVEYAKVTGRDDIIQIVDIAWNDIVKNRLYITGTTSSDEHFQDDHILPREQENNVGETCVTVTWLSLNMALFELKAEAKYGEQIEKTIYNHLSAAQSLNGNDWCYFTPLNGVKKFDKNITCCHSSGPRGIAMAPICSYLLQSQNGAYYIIVNSFEASKAKFNIGGKNIEIEQLSSFPKYGSSKIYITNINGAEFGFKIRIPNWSKNMTIKGAKIIDGWVIIEPQKFADNSHIKIPFSFEPVIETETGKEQYMSWGPYIMALEDSENPWLKEFKSANYQGSIDIIDMDVSFKVKIGVKVDNIDQSAIFKTFADAGQNSQKYRIFT